jgi:hypothetical protein
MKSTSVRTAMVVRKGLERIVEPFRWDGTQRVLAPMVAEEGPNLMAYSV